MNDPTDPASPLPVQAKSRLCRDLDRNRADFLAAMPSDAHRVAARFLIAEFTMQFETIVAATSFVPQLATYDPIKVMRGTLEHYVAHMDILGQASEQDLRDAATEMRQDDPHGIVMVLDDPLFAVLNSMHYHRRQGPTEN